MQRAWGKSNNTFSNRVAEVARSREGEFAITRKNNEVDVNIANTRLANLFRAIFVLAEWLPTSATLHLLNSISSDDENYTFSNLSTPTNNLCFRSLPTIWNVARVF